MRKLIFCLSMFLVGCEGQTAMIVCDVKNKEAYTMYSSMGTEKRSSFNAHAYRTPGADPLCNQEKPPLRQPAEK